MFSSHFSFRYKNVERLAAEEYEKERAQVTRTRPDLNLTFEPAEAWPSSSRSSTPSSFASQEDAEVDLESETPAPSYEPSETGRTTKNAVIFPTFSGWSIKQMVGFCEPILMLLF